MKKYFLFLFLIFLKLSLAQSSEESLEQAIHFNANGPNPIGYLQIGRDRAIDQSTFIYVKFALERFKQMHVPFVILELNTPGGELFPAMNIAELLQKLDTNDHIPVVAFIDNWAISAGAMLAYSCRFIGTVNSASMGAAEPVLAGEGGKMESASEKVNSVLRSELGNLASFYGRNPLLAEAMVDKDIILVLRDGKIEKLPEESMIRTGEKNPDIVITNKGKLLTLNAEQLVSYGVADFMVSQQPLPPISESEEIKGEWLAEKNLLFHQSFFAKIPQATIVAYRDWRVDFFAFLSHPVISSFLFMGLIIGVYMELNHPGFGFPGILAVTCLALILLSSFAVQAVNWIEVIILVAGIVLLLIEFFVIPGFGITGILGILLTIGGLFAIMLPSLENVHFSLNTETLNLVTLAVLNRLAWLCGALLLALGIIVIIARYFSHRFPLFNRLVLKGEQNTDEGYVSGPSLLSLPPVGSKGVAFSPLRPSGKIEIEGKIYDAVTEWGFIEKDEQIVVLKHAGSKLIIKKV